MSESTGTLQIVIYTPGSQVDYKKNGLTRGPEFGNFLYFSRSKYSRTGLLGIRFNPHIDPSIVPESPSPNQKQIKGFPIKQVFSSLRKGSPLPYWSSHLFVFQVSSFT